MLKTSEELAGITRDWLDWLHHGRQVSPHTLTAYQRDLASFVAFLYDYHGRVIALSDIVAAPISDFRAWLAALSRQDYDLRSSRRALSALRNFYQYLALQKDQENTAIALVKLPRLSQTLPRPLTIMQMMDLLAQIPGLAQQPWVGLRDCALFTLIYATGLRISEALSLKSGDWQEQHSLIILGKGRKQRQVPLIPQVHEAMQAYMKACPYHLTADRPLFVGASGKPLHASVAQRQLRFYRQVLGLPDTVTPHALRHSCATHLMSSSHDLRGVQELLGHAKLSTTQIYTKLDAEQLLDTFRQAHPRMGKV